MKDILKMNADMKVQCALYEFERVNGIRPNRIVMGYRLLDELVSQFYYMNVQMKTLEEAARERKLCVCCEYEGIPVKTDYDNPELLEVGYMAKWTE
jgi:hypothetical protein